LGNLTQDTTELDLWSFEEDLDLEDSESRAEVAESTRSSSGDIPAPRERQVTKVREAPSPLHTAPVAGGERIQMNISKSRHKPQTNSPVPASQKPESEFDELEHWEDVPKEAEIDELPDAEFLKTNAEEPVARTPLAPAIEPLKPAAAEAKEDDEFSPPPREDTTPLSPLTRWNLSKAERTSLIVLLVLLAAGGLATLVFSLKRLPTESVRANANDFPIQGSKLTVTSAVSYWRAPITEGPTPDTFRRGTQLLPVLELKIGGGSGAIRVLFRNDERIVIGDAVTRAVRGTGSLKIAATAGFDDPGMHAAYRTGESKPWTIEVFEAASEDTTSRDFKRLFEMNISTDRR
jgi:hypothetical protein